MPSLNKSQYIQLKNLSYQMYILDYKTNSNKAKNLLKEESEKYDHEELKKIVSNTLLFPFDVELFDYLKDKELNESNISIASLKFDIPVDLIKQKLKEYMEYNLPKQIEDGMIDYKDISFIYSQMLSNSLENEKNTKLS